MKHNYDIELLPLHLWRYKETDAYKILYHFFDYISLDMCRQLLQKWFTAAFAETYAWKNETAALLSFYERFEVLLYGCWLLCNDEKTSKIKEKKTSKLKVSTLQQHKAERVELFKHLGAYEMHQPLSVFQTFFSMMDLNAWRIEMYNWFEAGLSKQSILHITDTDNVLPVMEQLNKLVEAAYVIYQMHLGTQVKRDRSR